MNISNLLMSDSFLCFVLLHILYHSAFSHKRGMHTTEIAMSDEEEDVAVTAWAGA